MRRSRLRYLPLAAWLGIALGRGGFWRFRERLGAERAPGDVVAVVPAREEAGVLPETLPGLVAQAPVVVVDDESADGTADAARAAGARVVEGTPTPAGWAGKVWALAQGVEAAGAPEWLLLRDADVDLAPGVVERLLAQAERGGFDLVSVMALLRADTPGERLVIPAFVYFFALLYPFGRATAAAGGCVLVRRAALERAGGAEAIRGALIDDIALAQAVARAGGRTWLCLDPGVRSVRPYGGLRGVWRMVARSAYVQLRRNPALLAGTVAGLGALFLGPAAAGRPGLAAYGVMSATYLPIVRYHGLPAPWALTLPAAGILYSAMTLDSALRTFEWKGRRSPEPAGSAARGRPGARRPAA